MNMEFIVDKETKTVLITKEFDAERDMVWDAYTKQSFSINGGPQNLSRREPRLWNSERAAGDSTRWSAPREASVGYFRNTIPSHLKPISSSLTHSPTKLKILSCRV